MSKGETGYYVRYVCPACDCEWQDQWSCACDDECPNCGTTCEADDYWLDGTKTQAELDAYNGVTP